MSIKDRIDAIIEVKGLTRASFERKCGLSNGFINNIVKGIGEDKIAAILRVFPDIDKVWLLTGEGNMLTSQGANIPTVGGNVTTIGNVSGMTESPVTVHGGGDADFMATMITSLQEQNRVLAEQNKMLCKQIETLTGIITNLTAKG